MAQEPADVSSVLIKLVSDLAKDVLSVAEALLQEKAKNKFAKLTDSPVKEEDTKQKKKKKAEKDPNAPKRSLSSYMLYSQSVRSQVVEENPNLKAVDVAKLIGEKWNGLSEKEKKPFVKQAQKKKAKYNKALDAYKKSTNENAEEKSDTKRKSTAKDTESKKKAKKEEHDDDSSS